MANRFCVNLTHAKDNQDKATVAFVVANAAVGSGKETLVFLRVEGVRLAQKGYADDVREEGFAPLRELTDNFAKAGGSIYVCSPCFKKRRLVELGELTQAEAEVAAMLEESADDLDTLRLFSKIKHMRGQLSLALACYAQLQARGTAPGESARLHLESMLRMAQDPERGAGEFLAVGQRLVQKPTAYLALEEGFRLYVARRPHEARAVCRRAAGRYRERDAEVYKLAVLAQAWISELSGDLEAACAALEYLGLERGFEADLDRVMALVGLYELIGTRDKLEAAVNICRFLERSFGPRFVAGRLPPLPRT